MTMNKRFKSIILICVLCTILVGCGSSSASVPTDSAEECYDSSDICIPDGYVSIGSVEDYELSLDKYFGTLFYDTHDNHVVNLVYVKVPRGNSSFTRAAAFINVEIDGEIVYYDTENDCLTTEPVQNN